MMSGGTISRQNATCIDKFSMKDHSSLVNWIFYSNFRCRKFQTDISKWLYINFLTETWMMIGYYDQTKCNI